MSQVTNTFSSYGAKGIREDLSNLISNISPEDTPFMSNVKRSKVSQTLTEWQTISLAAADGTNAQIEGDDVTSFSAASATTRIGNYTQISRKTLILSDTLEETNRAGRKSELSFQISLRGAELKRDMETIFLRNQGAVAGDDSTARKLGSLCAFVKTNVDKGAGGSNPVWTNIPTGVRTDDTTRSFTETILKNVAELVWSSGGDCRILMLSGLVRQTASGFAGIATQTYYMAAPKVSAIIGSADIYISDFGKLSIVANRFQRASDGWFIDPAKVSIAYLRPFRVVKLAKTGDAEKRMLLAEYTLKVDNEAALGLAADLKA